MDLKNAKDIFIKHNNKYLKFKKIKNTKKKILIEFSRWSSLHVSSSYLLKVLQTKFNANIVTYLGNLNLTRPIKMSLFDKIKWFFGNFFSIRYFGIFKSIGASEFLWPDLKSIKNSKTEKIYQKIYSKIKSKRDLENLKIYNIWIGDLIYDSYLKYYNEETVDILSLKFKNYLKDQICLFLFWFEYINQNQVKAFIISHSVYSLALPARIAIKKNIKVYVCHGEYLYSLDKSNLFIRANFLKAKATLKKIDKRILKIGLKKAKNRIESRLKGKRGYDLWWAKKSSFGIINQRRVLSRSNKFKFLIANHSFIDSPHVYGKNLFPDFFEWLTFIGNISLNTDHEWYLKTHPYTHEKEGTFTKDVIKKFLKKYPKIKLIPSTVTHNQLVKEGINCVLTVLGSVGFEYAYMNVPVINASKRNPHINFDFNIHAKSLSDYKNLLINPKQIKLKIKKNEVLKYYFLMHIFYTRNWLFDNYEKMQKEVKNQYDPEVYKYWIKNEFSILKHEEVLSAISKFIESSDYRLTYKHLNKSFFDENF